MSRTFVLGHFFPFPSPSSFRFRFVLLLLFLLRGARLCYGAGRNVTIDDTLGDLSTGARPVYVPRGGVNGWEDATCRGCAIQPDPTRAHNGTWTAVTYNPTLPITSVEFGFTGTAIFVYFILANFIAPGITTITECNFTLDGTPAGNFTHEPSTSLEIEYDALVFSRTGLRNTEHKMLIGTSGVDHDVFVNFDYALYTVPERDTDATTTPIAGATTTSSTTSKTKTSLTTSSAPAATTSSSSTPAGAIAGGVVGGIAGLSVLLAALWFCRRRQRRKHTPPSRQALDLMDDDRPMTQAYRTPTQFAYSPFGARPPPLALAPPPSVSRAGTTYGTRSSSAGGNSGLASPPSRGRPSTDEYSRSEYTGVSDAYGGYMIPMGTGTGTTTTTTTTTSSSLARGPLPSVPSSNTRTTSLGTTYTIPSSGIMDVSYEGMIPRRTMLTVNGVEPIQDESESESDPKAQLRRARQKELERQMRNIQKELRDLTAEAAGRRASLRESRQSQARNRGLGGAGRRREEEDAEEELNELREQIRVMKQQLVVLQGSQLSEWALGLSDEPPPGYTPEDERRVEVR